MTTEISKEMAKEIIDEAESGVLVAINVQEPFVIGDVDEIDYDVDSEMYIFEDADL